MTRKQQHTELSQIWQEGSDAGRQAGVRNIFVGFGAYLSEAATDPCCRNDALESPTSYLPGKTYFL